MMHVIIGENLHDADYVSKYTLGFEQLREKVKEYPPERVARWTGIAADDIRRLAREYATTRSEEHTSELQSPCNLVCRLLLEKKHDHPRVRHQARQRRRGAAVDELRRHGRLDAAAGPRPGTPEPARLRYGPAGRDRRAAAPLL